MTFEEIIAECEANLRNGRADLVTRRLSVLKTSSIPRDLRLTFAGICRRSGMVNQGLRILAPVVRPEHLNVAEATDSEKCEYAFLIMKTGSVTEALKILLPIQDTGPKEVKLYIGYCHILRWDHETAIPYLKSYIKDLDLNYTTLVARVNLAAALVSAERWEESLELLSEILDHTQEQSLIRLRCNCLELRSQVHLRMKNYEPCRSDLALASQLLDFEKSSDQLFVMKWKAILEGLITNSEEPILRFRQTALEREHWESVRECDLFSLKIKFDRKKFEKLYFGTPYPSYRKRIERELGRVPETQEFIWGEDRGPLLNLLSGELISKEVHSKLTRTNHQTFLTLLRDLYRPLSLGGLFAELMPDEYFNPFTSPNRIHQVLWRTRTWIHEMNLPIEIREKDGQFHMEIQGPLLCRIPQNPENFDIRQKHLNHLKSAFGNKRFKSHEGMATLSMSRSSFFRLMEWALENERIHRQGKSSATWYHFTKAS